MITDIELTLNRVDFCRPEVDQSHKTWVQADHVRKKRSINNQKGQFFEKVDRSTNVDLFQSILLTTCSFTVVMH